MNNIISSSNTAQHHYYYLLCLIFIVICYLNVIFKTSTLLKVANVTMFLHRRQFAAKKWFDSNNLACVNINTFLVCSAHLYICIYW